LASALGAAHVSREITLDDIRDVVEALR